MSQLPALLYRLDNPIALVACTSETPGLEEWDRYLAAVQVHLRSMRAIVVSSDGGGPTALQRRQMREFFPLLPPFVVFSHSKAVRFILTAFNIFIPSSHYKMLAPSDWTGAATFLGLSPQEVEEARRGLDKLRRELGLLPISEAPRTHPR